MTSEFDQFIEHPVLRAMKRGRRVERIVAAARTDTVGVAHGEVNIYRDGDTLVMQIFDGEHATPAWRTATFT